MTTANPYLKFWEGLKEEDFTKNLLSQLLIRSRGVEKYSWAIPNQDAIDCLVKFSPLIEIGAGKGYWASLVSKAGGNIICFDKIPKAYDISNPDPQWFDVHEGDTSSVKEYKDRTLFLCWPPYNTSMAMDCLNSYEGEHLIYVGECKYGANANDEFFSCLEQYWKLISVVDIPQWMGIDDTLFIYKRKDHA